MAAVVAGTCPVRRSAHLIQTSISGFGIYAHRTKRFRLFDSLMSISINYIAAIYAAGGLCSMRNLNVARPSNACMSVVSCKPRRPTSAFSIPRLADTDTDRERGIDSNSVYWRLLFLNFHFHFSSIYFIPNPNVLSAYLH